jgi:acetate kinase
LEERSGLTGLAGTGDMAEVESAAQGGDQHARLAFDVYLHRLVSGVGAMSAATGGIDALAFTGGVGEHSAAVRRCAGERLQYLGVVVDGARNDGAHGDTDVTASGAPTRTFVIAAREDLQLAAEARRVMRPR